jgi:hypothetical protein
LRTVRIDGGRLVTVRRRRRRRRRSRRREACVGHLEK